jgi:hypothetical protein
MMSINIAVLFGTILAILATMHGLCRLRNSLPLTRSDKPTSPLIRIIPILFAVVAFPFAWWLGFLLGGNFGGAAGGAIAAVTGGEGILVPAGIGAGIFIATATISLVAAGVGLLLARLFSR